MRFAVVLASLLGLQLVATAAAADPAEDAATERVTESGGEVVVHQDKGDKISKLNV